MKIIDKEKDVRIALGIKRYLLADFFTHWRRGYSFGYMLRVDLDLEVVELLTTSNTWSSLDKNSSRIYRAFLNDRYHD